MLEGGIIGEIGTEAVAKDDAPDTIVAGLGGGDRDEVVEGVGGIKAAAAHFVGVDWFASSMAAAETLVVAAVKYCRMSVCVRLIAVTVGAAFSCFFFAACFRCFAFSFFFFTIFCACICRFVLSSAVPVRNSLMAALRCFILALSV